MGFMFNLASMLAAKQIKKEEERNPSPPRDLVAEKEAKTKAFMAEYGERLEELFKPYPNVYFWTGTSPNEVVINMRNPGPGQSEFMFGRLEFEEDGYTIKRWRASSKFAAFNRKIPDPERDRKIEVIKTLLNQTPNSRQYCDLVKTQLLDQHQQAFNARVCLEYSLDQFNREFDSEEWIKVWSAVLREKFNKSVEYKGNGVFLLY